MNEEYDKLIDPMTGEVSNWLEIPSTVITQDMVKGGDITVLNLAEVADDTYTNRSWMPTSDWLEALLDEK